MSIIETSFKKYQSKVFPEKKELMEGLKGGQSPHTLLLTCSDSRLSVADFCQADAGEVFVIRNAGNVIEEYNSENPSNEALTLEYGVSALGVKEVIVCGHSSCGAMGGVKDLSALDALPLVKTGLTRVSRQFTADEITNLEVADLIKLNVQKQLMNVYSYPFVKEKLASGDLEVYGYVYDFGNGELKEKISLRDLV
jgi:carbonic anhydrase